MKLRYNSYMGFLPLLLSLLFPFITHGSDSLKVITYNIRRAGQEDKGVNWKDRKNAMADYIIRSKTDILCIQEGLSLQVQFLDSIAGYDYVGVGRDDGKEEGEYCAIFYNKNKWQVKDSGTFWLSPDTKSPGIAWDAACTRICTWALFYNQQGQSFYVFNTHFDHIGKIARQESARLITARAMLMDPAVPLLICGDLNAQSSDKSIRIISELFRSTDDINQPPSRQLTSFNNWDASCAKKGYKIDYIFFNAQWNVIRYYTDQHEYNGKLLSDHYPVTLVAEPRFNTK